MALLGTSPWGVTVTAIRPLEVCHRRCAKAGVSFSMLSLLFKPLLNKSAEKAEPSETPRHTYRCLSKETFLRRTRHVGVQAPRAPNQGLENSFCCWIAVQQLAEKECCFHRHRFDGTPTAAQVKVGNFHVQREYPRNFESRNLSRDNLSREIGRTYYYYYYYYCYYYYYYYYYYDYYYYYYYYY